MGDFNEITTSAEKSSLSTRPVAQMKAFQQAMVDSKLVDLGYTRSKHTLCNDRAGRDYMRERLDRILANVGWCSIFNVMEVMVLARNVSDHNPLLVSLSKASDVCWNKSKIFRYEASWAKHRDHGAMIKKSVEG